MFSLMQLLGGKWAGGRGTKPRIGSCIISFLPLAMNLIFDITIVTDILFQFLRSFNSQLPIFPGPRS